MAHLLAGLGWVDCDLCCSRSTLCLTLPGPMGNWQKWLSRWARWASTLNQSQPNPGLPGDGPPCTSVQRGMGSSIQILILRAARKRSRGRIIAEASHIPQVGHPLKSRGAKIQKNCGLHKWMVPNASICIKGCENTCHSSYPSIFVLKAWSSTGGY